MRGGGVCGEGGGGGGGGRGLGTHWRRGVEVWAVGAVGAQGVLARIGGL